MKCNVYNADIVMYVKTLS